MKRTNITLIIAVALLCLNSKVFSQDGLILPMPGQKPKQTNTEVQKPSQPAPKTQNTNSDTRNTGNSSGVIIPLPQMNKNSHQENKPKQEKPVTVQPPKQEKPVDVHNEPLIVIPPMDNKPKNKPVAPVPPPQPEVREVSETPKPTENNSTMTSDEAFLSDFSNDIDDFPSPDGQITSSPNGNNVENILPPAEADTTVAQDSSGEKITIYPKDSGSAIFMVMKSWQCNDYDAASLINQALEVYGKDSAEPYQINGLENIAKGTTVSVEEEDITFDELLDILGSKTGNDWGCDIANKTIYIYPKGIKTESYVSWE
ncbi:MAG: hypothetical protein II567_14035 [Candidatus Riflebacteria bacterium]|nr:hypothetical protein [Candidatus Riflebacteria bacterium]